MLLPYSNLQVTVHNPGATKPLILPVQVVCNTSDEQIQANIAVNARRPGRWLAQVPAHDRVAVLCGSGPSLADHVEAIRTWTARGACLFALNGAARFLAEHGLLPDYQVLLDARPDTAELVGPARAHLFASQVDPACFAKMPTAQVWHLQITELDDCLPDYPEPFVEIGGAASVGNTALCLAYALGFRHLECYGYDSSHRNGQSHAFRQPLNDGDPCAWVRFGGTDYLVSLTMKLQAEKFPVTARELERLGVTIQVHGDGLLPAIWRTRQDHGTEAETAAASAEPARALMSMTIC